MAIPKRVIDTGATKRNSRKALVLVLSTALKNWQQKWHIWGVLMHSTDPNARR